MDVYYLLSLMAVIVPPIFGVITLIGSVGNILVIIVVASNKTMRNTPNILILNLAVADLFFLVLCVPFTAARYAMLGKWPFGIVMCKIVYYLISVSFFGSAYTLVLMAISRYLAIVHSIKSLVFCTARNTYIAISVMWMAILIGSSYYLRLWTLNVYFDSTTNTTVSYCDTPYLNNPYEMQKYAMCIFVLGYALPLVIITILYVVLVHHLFHTVVTGDETVKSGEDMRSKKRVAKMLVVVIAVFALCWFPQMALRLIRFYHDEMRFNGVFYVSYIASNCLGYFNSCVNPFIYALLSPQFRKGFQKLLCCSGRDFHDRRTAAASGKTTTLRLSGEAPA